LIDEAKFEEVSKYLALKYRVIHKIVKSNHDPNLICVFGQKAFNLIRLNKSNQLASANTNNDLIELQDWIFDVYWYQTGPKLDELYLIIVCAHNQCILYNLNTQQIDKIVYCEQKCMLYNKVF
jgi:hypothetical protein